MGLGLSLDYERWNFSDIAGQSGVDLWDEIFRPGISVPIFYSSAVGDGIGQVDFWAPFLRVGWRLGQHYRFDINGGTLVGGSIAIEDENGNELGDTDYDAAPFIGATLKGQF